MPFPFSLPTTSTFSFSTYFKSDTHPSLPLSASTYRGVLRQALKKHRTLPPNQQSQNLSSILLSLDNYLPYLLAIDHGCGNQPVAGEEVDVILKTTPTVLWRPSLSSEALQMVERSRPKFTSLEYEISFTLSTLAYTYTLISRTALHPLYSSATASLSQEQRTIAINTATKHLLSAGSIHDYLSNRADQLTTEPPSIDIVKSTFRALTSLALAEATLLAVLKDDQYPAAVAQDRNTNDKEWMIKAPEIPKVRAHLFARLCLAAAEHASNAHSLLKNTSRKGSKINTSLVDYVADLRMVARGKACRFFGIDAEIGGKTGEALAWLQAGVNELGYEVKEQGKSGLGLGRLKKEWKEKREDRKVEKGTDWGSDAGRAEERRVMEWLEKKWTKMNDTINTQVIPPYGPLIASMPSGREIHTLKQFLPPVLEVSTLESMRAPPDRADDFEEFSSDEDENQEPVGAFPGTKDDYTSNSKYY